MLLGRQCSLRHVSQCAKRGAVVDALLKAWGCSLAIDHDFASWQGYRATRYYVTFISEVLQRGILIGC